MKYAKRKDELEKLNNVIEDQKRTLQYIPSLNLDNIEYLKIDDLKKNYDNFEKCENLWEPLSPPVIPTGKAPIDFIKSRFSTMRYVLETSYPEEYRPYYEEEVMLNNLKLGKPVYDMYNIYRVVSCYEKCPLCGASIFNGFGGVSRRDNKTLICSDCASKEAIEDLLNERV